MSTENSQTIFFKNAPRILAGYSVVGPKEGQGAFKDYYDKILDGDQLKEKSYERAERLIFEMVIENAIKKAGLKAGDINALLSGDLLNQITASGFCAAKFDIPFLGLFGACATFTEAMALGAVLIDGGYIKHAACASGSHFSSVERQYRFPLELGTQRPPTAQWTVTGAGCSILGAGGKGIKVTAATMGKVIDYGIKDVNNMGGAMAPAAMNTIEAHLRDTGNKPDDYDMIVTGDLGKFGSQMLRELMDNKGIKLGTNYHDCGAMIFTKGQKVLQGGSGAGCAPVVFNSFILEKMRREKLKKVLFIATGALLSTVSAQQGDSIPCIAHAILVEGE